MQQANLSKRQTLTLHCWATVRKIVRAILSDRYHICLTCLWRLCILAKRLYGSRWNLARGRPRPRPYCVRWGPGSLQKGGQHVIHAGLKLEVSLTQKRLIFFRAFKSLHGSTGANFSHVVLKTVIAKHTSPYFCERRGGLGQRYH